MEAGLTKLVEESKAGHVGGWAQCGVVVGRR